MPLFCDAALAARIERAEAGLVAKAAAAGFVMPIAGGVATFAGPGSPFNKVAGLGFDGIPSARSLDEIERAFATRGAAGQGVPSHEDFPRNVGEGRSATSRPRPSRAGCDTAVVTTQPGSKSQQNVQRHGFDLLCTRAILVRQ